MRSQPASPRRRHILSSINPDENGCGRPPHPHDMPDDEHSPPGLPSVAARVSDMAAEVADDEHPTVPSYIRSHSPHRQSMTMSHGDAEDHAVGRFRFKSKRSSRRLSPTFASDLSEHQHHESKPSRRGAIDGDQDDAHEPPSRSSHSPQRHRSSHRHHRNHHGHHRRRRRRSRSPEPAASPPNSHQPPPLDPEAAFRESLWDAMADDEGAAYWQGVYGQPIHIYSNTKTGPQGELEQMTDDEYATYVRQKMWEKTHQGLLEERARREELRRKRHDRDREARRLTREMEESLRRGDERRRRKTWRSRWDEYVSSWSKWDHTLQQMRWPTQSGRREDVDPAAVREFLIRGLDPTDIGETEFLAKLKEERVRWHPDKMQQRAGGKLDGSAVKDVTAVFQIIDKLWSDTRSKQAK